ncbi:KAP family P-loop NTPase fold protein [Clostridium perfringens]|uniref:KAP family P-loop NTPase fold protein n=1 Tax=Clostridium perfringens TaxID=1502 RepID=UPI003F43AF0F
MSIKFDNAIKSKEEDLLGRKKFSINISENIINYKEESAITIGLIGKWGSGKSSVINMMKEHIKEKNKEIEFIDFNPWCFSGGNKLVEEFFDTLISYLGIDNNELNKLGQKLKLYSLAMKPLTFIPKVNKVFDSLEKITKASGEAIGEFCKQEKSDINSLKEIINGELKSLNKKIVITIDDIDRLENEEVKEIFKLVRAIGDFNNIIYILAFDEEKVCKVFSSGPDYIDKIINIPIYIPEVSSKAINEYFLKNIDKNFKLGEFNLKYFESIYKLLLENKFDNLRNVKRFLNILSFNKNWILREVNIIDYIIITFLKLYDKNIYFFIRDNKLKIFSANSPKKLNEFIKKSSVDSKLNIDISRLLNLIFDKSLNNNLRAINKVYYFDTYFEELLTEKVYTLDELNKYKNIESKKEFSLYLKGMDNKKILKIFDNLEEITQILNNEQKYFFEEILREKIFCLNKNKDIKYINKSEQEVAFDKLKNILSGLDDYKRILKSINLKEECKKYGNILVMNYILSIKNILNVEFDAETLKNIKEYIYSLKYDASMYNILNILRGIGIDVEEYLKYIISNDEGLIVYLKSTEDIIDCPRFDEDGEVINDDIGIILENITDFISYDYVKKRVENLGESFKKNNKNLIREFEQYSRRDEVRERIYGKEIY